MRSNDEQQRHSIYSSEHALVFPTSSQTLLVSDEPSVPLSIFSGRLSALQALVRYLHEVRAHPFVEIAVLLNRSQKTIWATYEKAKTSPFAFEEGGFTIPLARFASREFAPLETLVTFLDELGFSNIDSARMLDLDPRTTWTARKRAEKKQEVVA
ncbi:hypothetical protein GOV07_02545 [Candidatus Woesearchaeota archaeon]|nr:hypothetical protein [Candidatus Woesearchaeota archaeon]